MLGPSARDVVVEGAVDALCGGSAVLLTGLAGAGAWDLAERAAARLGDDGWHVVRLRGSIGVSGRAFAALALGGMSPRGATADAYAAGVARLVDGAGPGRGVVLVRHADLVDADTAAVVAAAGASRLGVLVTSSPGRACRTAALRSTGDLTVCSWEAAPLRFDEMQVLVHRELAGRADVDLVSRVYGLSGGLPGLARAILHGARRDGRLVLQGGVWSAVGEVRSAELVGTVDRLLAGLGGRELRALETLAVLGPVEPVVARRVVPWRTLVALEDAGLLRVLDLGDRDEVVVTPPLVAEHLTAAPGRERLVRTRRRVTREVERPAGQVAVASRGGAQMPSEWGTSRDEAAVLGRRLRRSRATRVDQRRDEWAAAPSTTSGLLWLNALLEAGSGAALLEAVEDEVITHLDPDGVPVVESWRALRLACVERDPGAARRVLVGSTATERTAVLDDTRRRIDLFLGTGPVPTATTPGSDRPEDRYVRGWSLLAAGRVVDAADVLSGEPTAHDPLRVDPRPAAVIAELLDGRVEAAVQHASRLLAEARSALDGAAVESCAYVLALCLALAGRSRALREHLWASLAVGACAPFAPHARAALLTIGASLAANDGRTVPARAMADQVTATALPLGPVPLASAGVAQAQAAVAAGDLGAAAAHGTWLEVDALLDRGCVTAAVLAASAAVDVAVDHPAALRVAAASAGAQGAVLPALGRYVSAVAEGPAARLADVADELRGCGLPVHAVRAYARAAHLATLAGDAGSAGRYLAGAEDVARGARGDLDRLLALVGPVASLSAREVEVARRVAAGAQNREVAAALGVSVRTVDNHLYRIYRKLGVTDREGLARRLA
ncbi:helix-turn-helix transcriptional regulator [Cellulomonas phragmiteti]|uniref:HTH luxR-type domain-containing protein n=1 Tax=Cellulomonas phragmiteti TaxID=478780 RepID=A0ABQ4DJD1_9CELL|nr:helix-turn-helix transcriptional regulator [Cellulomonas phragmiteti]GIG39458.1 hypothetical protein Cph01nite_12200 [Cellulomonas phragmiteti]